MNSDAFTVQTRALMTRIVEEDEEDRRGQGGQKRTRKTEEDSKKTRRTEEDNKRTAKRTARGQESIKERASRIIGIMVLDIIVSTPKGKLLGRHT